MGYYGRISNHIESDIARGWSSCNFGEDGVWMTEEQLEELKAEAQKKVESGDHNEYEDIAIGISYMFPTWEQLNRLFEKDLIRPLYYKGNMGYFVVVDEEFKDCLAGIDLNTDSLEEAIEKMRAPSMYLGGDTGADNKIYVSQCQLVWSEGDKHIFYED